MEAEFLCDISSIRILKTAALQSFKNRIKGAVQKKRKVKSELSRRSDAKLL